MSDFPTDDATLILLAESCRINAETGRTHLHDFLDMGTRVKTATDITADVGEGVGTPVYEVEYEQGYEPYSPNGVILALVAEVQRLRAEARPE